MKVLKSEEMREVDRRAIQDLGIPSLLLMERAGLSVVEVIKREFPKAKRVLVVAGKGNNGGDGLVAVRHLSLLGYHVDYVLALGEELKGDAQTQLSILRRMGLEPKAHADLSSYDLIVDALFGTGFEPPARGDGARWIELIKNSGLPVLSLDLPSGLSADRGRIFEPSVRAYATVALQFPKLCHVLHPSAKLCGKLFVANIGIPPWLAEGIYRDVITGVFVPEREADVHKGKMGHVLLVGGSEGKTGAVIMAARACTRAGAGLVSVGVPKGLNPIFETALIEEMSVPLLDGVKLSLGCVEQILDMQERFSAVVVGMGMGRYKEGAQIIRELIVKVKKPLLLDADALNNLADTGIEILKQREGLTVLTPHVGEFERLSGLPKDYIVENLTDVALEFAQKYGCYLVLKSSRTAIATPQGRVYLSLRGTPAMAKGGVGDVLSGMLSALIGRGLHPEDALKLGVFLHGLAGEVAQKKTHRESLRALDLVEAIGEAYNLIEDEAYEPSFAYIP